MYFSSSKVCDTRIYYERRSFSQCPFQNYPVFGRISEFLWDPIFRIDPMPQHNAILNFWRELLKHYVWLNKSYLLLGRIDVRDESRFQIPLQPQSRLFTDVYELKSNGDWKSTLQWFSQFNCWNSYPCPISSGESLLSYFSGNSGGVRGFFGINHAYADEIQLPPEQQDLASPYQYEQSGKDGGESIRGKPPILRRFLCGFLLVLGGGLLLWAINIFPSTWHWWL